MYRLFFFLEQGILDPLNEYHLYALHFIYLPRINRSLEEFRAGWNHYSICTERNATPLQLFSAGALCLRNSGAVAVDFFDHVEDNYGVEEEGVVMNDGGVEIPENHIQLSGAQYSELQSRIDPLTDSDDSVLSYMNVLWTSYKLLLLADLDFVCMMYVKFMSL